MKPKEADSAPKTSSKNSLRTLLIFCGVVAIVIVASLCYKIFLMIQHSKFDGTSGFIMAVVQDDRKKAVIYSFDPGGKTFSHVYIQSQTPLSQLGKNFSIPIEGLLRKKTVNNTGQFPFEFQSYSLYNQSDKRDISFLDAFRLWLYSHSIPDNKKQSATITLPKDKGAYESLTENLFIDKQLEDDKQSITIVNGTAISGLGGRLEKVLSNIGGSVISITTSHDYIPQSRIVYYGEKGYTVDRLQQILQYPVEAREGIAVSDILIEIGENSQRTDAF